MKKYTIIILSFLFVCLFFAYGLNAQHGIVVFGKDTLCINNINLDNISHGEEGVSFVCNDTILTRNIADVDSISIMKIPDCIVIEQGIDDWSEMRLCSDGTVALTKMLNENTPLEMMMMCPNDSMGAVFSKITFDENAFPTEITMNEYKLLVDWTDETQFNLTILSPDSIAYRVDSLTYTVEQRESGKRLVPDIDKKPWMTRLGGVLELVGGGVAFVGGAALIFGSGVAEIGTAGSSTPISVPGIVAGGFSVKGGIESMFNGWINAFTNDYVNGLDPIINTLSSLAAAKTFEKGVVPNLPNKLFPYLADSKYKLNDLYSLIPTLLGEAISNIEKPYTWFDLVKDVQENVLTGLSKNITQTSATTRGYINPYILESPSVKFETEYGMIAYSATNSKERDIQKVYNGDGGMIEFIFNDLNPGTTYKYCTYYIDKTNNVLAVAKEKSFTTLTLPVKITNFKQTGSHYNQNGYSYKGKTYSYKYDVTVTVELTDPEGVADWGYVYEDERGDSAHISLKDFYSPYPDDRYIYYRNEDKSTVRLFEYVKYEGSDGYEYGDPVDYPVQYTTLSVITGDVSSVYETDVVICGYVEGIECGTVEDAGICYKRAQDISWDYVSAQSKTDGYFYVYVDNLQSGAKYDYCAYAYADGEYYYGEVYEFTTKGRFPICPDDNHPHMIDLGLPSGTKWACCNMGAYEYYDDTYYWSDILYGDYYAWGETKTKYKYSWDTYEYAVIDDVNGDLYNYDDSNPHYYRIIHIGYDIAGTEYDVAHVKWGGSWRMPSKEQFQELIDNCTRTFTYDYGIGSIYTGPNGNAIFLPYAGECWDYDEVNRGVGGFYWTSTLEPYYDGPWEYYKEYCASCLKWDKMGKDQRCEGHSVRPVCP